MEEGDSLYQIGNKLEMDDSYFRGRNISGKIGCGAAYKVPVVIAVQTRQMKDKIKPAYIKMQVVDNIEKKQVKNFVSQNIRQDSKIRTDGFKSYLWLEHSECDFDPVPVLSPKEASKKFLWVHIMLGNIKGIIRGVHHGVSKKYLKNYLTEFCYKFNRRFIEEVCLRIY